MQGAALLGVVSVMSYAAAGPPDAKAPMKATQADFDFFEAKVRPLLLARCAECHTDNPEANLRIDSREGLLKGGDLGAAIIPGDPDGSLVIKMVKEPRADLRMPRKKAPLTADEVDVLVSWIRGGAPWPERAAQTGGTRMAGLPVSAGDRAFWSFQPLAHPSVPQPKNENWPSNDVDRFILMRLEKEGLAPVETADRRALIRRATLDLAGVPPTAEEIDAFLKDESPEAFASLVDRLLASPRYGEVAARAWLDVARYAEDDYRSLDPMRRGYNPYPNAYRYRDWVIKAFNDDLPWDTFVKAQLAGDLLDEPQRVRMLPATGFLGLGPWYYDNGAVEITHADERHDRVDAVSRGFLGLTVGCARCHDHKYDPIPTKDYYSLAGVFLNTTYHEYPMVPKAVFEEYKAQDKRIENKEKLLEEFLETEGKQLSQALALQAKTYMRAAYRVTGPLKEEQARVADKEKLDYELFDRWIKFLAKPPKNYKDLVPWQEMIRKVGTKEEAGKIADAFQERLVDLMFEKKETQEANEIITAKALPENKKKKPANLPNEFITNDDFCPGCGLELKSLPIEKTNLWVDVFERDLRDDFDPNLPKVYYPPGLLSFRGWGLERQLSGDHRRYIEALRADIGALRKAQTPKFAYVHGVQDAEKPVEIKVHLRGNPMRLGDEVPRRFLTVLNPGEAPAFVKGSGRLELAETILKQPLTARVIVNRVFKSHFGAGIVDTPSNFGKTGDRPAHPELLDHLANYFLEQGGSFKKLHRYLMLSTAYRLSSKGSADALAKDPANRLYGRSTPHRMTAEQIRDSVLSVAGALDDKLYGPSDTLNPFSKRRTVYGKVSRYKLDEYLQLFDFPSPSQSAEKRFSTTVPLQRLFFMNSDFMQQYSETLSARTAAAVSTRDRIQSCYKFVFGRAATDDEIRAAETYLAAEPMRQYQERKVAAADPAVEKAAKEAATAAAATDGDEPESGGMMAGVTPGAKKADAAEKLLPVTVWGRYVKVLLSSTEFLFVN